MEVWGEWCTVTVTVIISTTVLINKKQKKVGTKYLLKILEESSLETPYAGLPWLFCFMLLELVKGGYKGVWGVGE